MLLAEMPPARPSSDDCPDAGCTPPSAPRRTRGWTWKVADSAANPGLGLRYEPGNWGDVLKGTWATIVAPAVAVHSSARDRAQPLRYLDPFAGAPTYPLLETVVSRLVWLGSSAFIDAQRTWLERGELASTGLLVDAALARARVVATLDVFDLDPARRAAWVDVPRARVLPVDDGLAALESTVALDADLVLIDPYDFFTDWRRTLAALSCAATRATLLVYLYNKSPRGAAVHREYRRLRAALALPAGTELLVGRVPSDAVLPRAFHEMWLVAEPALIDRVRSELSRATRRLACKLSTAGAFESIRPDDR